MPSSERNALKTIAVYAFQKTTLNTKYFQTVM
jgi:hypothetical protein